ALGITQQLPLDEKHGYSKKYIEGRLAIMMGGRAAEEIIFNELTTGAGNDIEQATAIARKMVCEWGMSELLGPMTFGKKNEEIFLGREIQTHRDFSEETAKMIDEEVVMIIRKAQKTAQTILNSEINVLHRMAEELLNYETIDKVDIKKILSGKKINRPKINSKHPAKKKSGGSTKKKSVQKPVS
ncbi:MAG: cell division protein FtsH, partial [Candidatus Neomarinimicrobiota bacterium]